MRCTCLYLFFCLFELLYICYTTVFSLNMVDLTDTNPIDLGFNNVLEDCCNYVDLTELDPKRSRSNLNGLNVLLLNSRGVLSKQELLKELLKDLRMECKVHVVLLVETWLTSKNSKRFKVPGYNFVSSIGHRHSRLSILGTSNFLKKIGVLARGYFYSLSSQLWSPLCRSCCFIHVTSLSFNWVLVFCV